MRNSEIFYLWLAFEPGIRLLPARFKLKALNPSKPIQYRVLGLGLKVGFSVYGCSLI